MISQSDIEGRLRLFRYGLVVLVVVTFLVSLLTPYAYINNTTLRDTEGNTVELQEVALTDFLEEAVIYTVVVAILAVILYFAYAWFLRRTVGDGEPSGAEGSTDATEGSTA